MAYNITALIPRGRNARLAGGLLISNMPPLVHVTERSIRNLLEEVITRFKKYEAFIVAPSDYIPKIGGYDERIEDALRKTFSPLPSAFFQHLLPITFKK